MRIPLTDPIWSRLHGPYGVQDVAGTLQRLEVCWDEALAQDLFWERLHHQETLYPVTYAALPWLWHLVARAPARSETLPFLSHVLSCAYRPCTGGAEHLGGVARYAGPSLEAGEHRLDRFDQASQLWVEDLDVLEQLQNWFRAMTPAIAEACLRAVSGTDRYFDAQLLTGPADLQGAPALAMACDMWGAEEPMERILEQAAPATEADRSVATAMADAVAPFNAALAVFLRTWAVSPEDRSHI